jgi:hypothetical protein
LQVVCQAIELPSQVHQQVAGGKSAFRFGHFFKESRLLAATRDSFWYRPSDRISVHFGLRAAKCSERGKITVKCSGIRIVL